jgi:N-acetylneuraminate synthase
MIEKHLTLKRSDGGVDSHFSLEPAEFRSLVEDVRRAEAMIGEVRYGPGAAEAQSMSFRRSLYVVEDVRRGEPFTRDNLRSIRPGFGLAPQHLDVFIGRRAAIDIERGTPLTWEHLSGN